MCVSRCRYVYGVSAPACSHLTRKEEQLSFVKSFARRERRFCVATDVIWEHPLSVFKILPFVFHHTPGLIGFGKSSAVLVISPLVSLMVDQVQKLRSRDAKTFISSSCTGIVGNGSRVTGNRFKPPA